MIGTSKAALNMLCSVLAVEEPLITTISVRPGVVDTDMQEELRREGRASMNESVYQLFLERKEKGALLQAEKPAGVISSLVISCDRSMNGQMINWDDVRAHQ